MTYFCRASLAAALVLGLVACGHRDTAEPSVTQPKPASIPVPRAPAAAPAVATPDKPAEGGVVLAMHATHGMSDTASITFGGVVDSRCPSDVQCVSAGEAHALFLVAAMGQPDATVAIPVHALSQDDPAQRYRSASGHRFYLLSLEPHPSTGVDGPNEGYVARLRIEPDPPSGLAARADAAPGPDDVATPSPAPGPRVEIPGIEDWGVRQLAMHQRLALSDNAAMTLAGVIESRCPAQYACAWEGEAEVLFLVTTPGQPAKAVALQWGANSFHDPALRYKTIAGHRVVLESIEPAPETDAIIPSASYRATLRVEGLPPH